MQIAEALEPLLGYAAPVRVWLEDMPACRINGYGVEQLERWLQEQGLLWQGCGPEQIRIGYPEDLLLATSAEDGGGDDVVKLFSDQTARYGFLQLADRQSETLTRFNELWWASVWRGEIIADSLTPLRQALSSKYRLGIPEPRAAGLARPRSRARSGARSRARPGMDRSPRYPGSRAGIGWPGNWMLSAQPEPGDPLTDLEDARERARMLLDRYGVVCRELANREGGPFRWRDLFRALRIMELAGEVVAGLFFDSLSGPQFALPDALRTLRKPDLTASFWVNALDPVSPCGLGLRAAKLPPRRPGNYLSYHGGDLALVVESHGKRLSFRVPPEHPELQQILAPVSHLLLHRRRLTLTAINDEPPADSPYRPALESIARFVTDHRQATLEYR
jgi:ATP-dependent Lhr-like helicase